jgi:hypothetical protein
MDKNKMLPHDSGCLFASPHVLPWWQWTSECQLSGCWSFGDIFKLWTSLFSLCFRFSNSKWILNFWCTTDTRTLCAVPPCCQPRTTTHVCGPRSSFRGLPEVLGHSDLCSENHWATLCIPVAQRLNVSVSGHFQSCRFTLHTYSFAQVQL